MKPTRTFSVLLLALLALPLVAAGQDNEDSTAAAANDEVIDNIVVAAQKSTAELRQDLWDSEDDFYTLYNKLNDDSLYDVRCSFVAPTGSRIKNQVCHPVFLKQAMANGQISRVTNLNANPVIAGKMARFRDKLDTLLATNTELQAAAVTFSEARTRYMAQSDEATATR
jgi:hypothetical protein